jgi:hypothetical protein
MGIEKWILDKLNPLLQTDKEYLIVLIGLSGIGLFLYLTIS